MSERSIMEVAEAVRRSPGTLAAIQSYKRDKGLTGALSEYDYAVLLNSHHCGNACDKQLLAELMTLTQKQRHKVFQSAVELGNAVMPRSKSPVGDGLLSLIGTIFQKN
tara:strand:+ start:398 stop:721 length:324 start_codon:yes stop_codon:yes gene_type:complete